MTRSEDLTAKARIRDTALACFAEQGQKGTSMRAIAARADVSLALVQYHFGSKQGLLDACDAHVIEFFRQELGEAVDKGRLDDPAFISEAYREAPPVLRYLGRALAEDSPAAASLFDELVDLTERYLADRPGARDQAAVYTSMRLGVYVLHGHLSRALGTDSFSPEAMARVAAAQLAIVSEDFAGADRMTAARSSLDRYTNDRPDTQEKHDE